jgi:hypothetical protein
MTPVPPKYLRTFLVINALSVGTASGSPSLPHGVSGADLCVTEGTITERPASPGLDVDSPKMRAIVNAKPVQSIEARFTYLGASTHDVPLGSGTMRRQFGLKLRAQDACNLIYAMWRIEPESKLVISIKENPGQHSSAECGNRGYRNVKPERTAPIPQLRSGDAHTLRAETKGADLNVYIDGTLAWQGPLAAQVLKWDERVGIRSDNVRAQFELRTPPRDQATTRNLDCKSEPSEAE